MRIIHSSFRWLLVALVLAWSIPAPGQGSGQISGAVTDEQGAMMPGVTVTLRNQETGVTRTAVTEADGRYRFGALSPGHYSLKADVGGFQSLEVSDLILTIGFQMTQNLSLKIAAVEETVTVTGESPLVDIASTEVSSLITKEQIAQLPINSRSYLSLSLLVPGVSPDVNRGFFESVQVGGGSTFNSTRNIVDGVTNNWIEDGEPRQDIPEDAVEQFKISNAQFSPEYGMATAGVIQIVTKSGTNSFHGTAYEYFRDKALNAEGVFEDEKPEYRRNQYGGSIGGPIIKDKMHFFAAMERTKVEQFYTVNTGLPEFYSSVEGTFEQPAPRYMYMGRFDYQINNSSNLFATFNWEDQQDLCSGCGGVVATGAGSDGDIPRRSVTVGQAWVPDSRKLNDFRFLFATGGYFYRPTGAPVWKDPGDFSEERLQNKTRGLYFPSLIWGTSYDEEGPETRWEFRDAFTIARENHTIKFGGEFSYNQYEYAISIPLGEYTFGSDQYFDPNDQASIDNLTDAVLFTAVLGNVSTPKPTTYYAGFLQDDWQVGDNLVLYLGLRYEREINCCNEELDPSTFPRPIPFIDVSKRGDPNNFAPRLGLSWDVRGDGRTALKGGYGVYYGHVRIFREIAETTNLQRYYVAITNPPYPDPYGGRDPLEFVEGGPPPITVVDNDYVQPYSQQFSLGLEHQLSRDLAISVDGIYNYTIKEQKRRDINAKDPITGLRPNPDFDRIDYLESTGFVKYRALYAKLEKRFSGRNQFVIAYTFNKITDNSPVNPVDYLDPFDKSLDIGPGRFERRHALVASGSVLLPYDFTLGVVWQYRTPLPFNAVAGRDLNEDGNATDLVPGTTRNSGNRNLNLAAVNTWRAANGLGPVDESQIQTNRVNVVDFRIAKQIPVGQGKRFELMFQVFNLFNTTNYGGLQGSGRVTNALSDSFGRMVTAKPKTQAEVAVKFLF